MLNGMYLQYMGKVYINAIFAKLNVNSCSLYEIYKIHTLNIARDIEKLSSILSFFGSTLL